MKMQLKVSALHPYLNGRLKEINEGLYPKHHLWGTFAISDSFSSESLIRPYSTPSIFAEKLLNKFLLGPHSPGFAFEIAAYLASFSNDLIYSVCGPLSIACFSRRSKIFSWVFSPPPSKIKHPFDPFHKSSLKRNSGFLCLTPKAEQYFLQYAPAKFIPWCVDLEMFDGKPPKDKPIKPFFLANGKTGRDYHTLVNAAYKTEAEIRIIGPKNLKPFDIPENVIWINNSSNPPDQAIDYPTLKEWYAQCSGVCIPLSGNPDDTCGYTNMLEAMAMRKPVVMTQSGCLHIDPASRNFGMLVKPGDSQGWSDAMNRILNDSNYARESGENGRKIAEEEFSIERFNRDVVSFINEVIKS
jgi:glycosyltransferase involved in cell wall biosynthesis